MANKTVYTLDLDTSKLISKYKDAISEMEKAGVATDVTKGLSKSLEKLQKEYESLSTAGKAGFTNSKQIENFQKRVEKLMTSFRGFETELGDVGDKINSVAKKSTEAGKKLQNAFGKLGFKDSAKAMNEVVKATDREAKLGEIVEAELKSRAEAVKNLKAQYEAAARAAEEASSKASGNSLSSQAGAKIGGKNVWTSGQHKPNKSQREDISAQAEAIAKSAKNAQEAWQQFMGYLQANNLDKVFNSKALPGVEEAIKNMQRGYAEAAPAIEAATQAQERLNEAEQSFSQIGKRNKDGTIVPLKNATRDLSNELRNYEQSQTDISSIMENGSASAQDMARAEQEVANAAGKAAGAALEEENAFQRDAQAKIEAANATEKTTRSFEQLRDRMLMFFSITSIFNSIRNEIRKTYEDVKQLDKSFASIAMVTQYSVKEMWSSYSLYADMASQLGQKTNDVIQASALFYQQGLDTNEALALTTDTMKLATLAGNDFATATQEMTSAIRGFKMEMDEGGRVADVYSNLAAHAAARVDDIAQAMARTASIANSAGMSFENTSAFLTQMIETTQESAENIGTSLKTIIARFTELKENVAGTSDSEFEDLDYNKVDKALKSVGVSLKDTTGQFRNLDEVFMELSEKWDTLDRNTQRYVATIAAGSRQQSRFIAMMDNYERTAQLMEYATNAEGKADEQFAKYADTMEYKLNQLNTKWEEFRVSLLNSETVKGTVDLLSELLDRVSEIKFDSAGQIIKNIGLIGIAIKNLKTTLMAFLSNTAGIVTTAKKLGTQIGTSLTAGLKKKINNKANRISISVNIDKAKKDIDNLTSKIEVAKRKYGKTTYEAFVKANPDQLVILEKAFDTANTDSLEFKNTLAQLGIEMDDFNQAMAILKQENGSVSMLAHEFKQTSQEIDKATMKLQSLERMSSTVGTLMSSAFSAAVTSISLVGTGAITAKEGLSMFLLQMGTLAAQTAIQIGLDWALAAAKAKATKAAYAKAVADHSESAANLEVAASAASAAVAEYAMLWPLLLIVGAVAAVGIAAGVFFGKTKKSADEAAYSVNEVKKAMDEATANKKSEATELATAAKEAKDLKKEYDELANKAYLTAEEEERYHEVMKEINDKFPEVVQYYDTVNNKLVIANDLWDDILEKQDKQAKEAKAQGLILSTTKVTSDQADVDANALAAQKAANDEIWRLSQVQEKLMSNITLKSVYGYDISKGDINSLRTLVERDIQDEIGNVGQAVLDLNQTVGKDDDGVEIALRAGENAELIKKAVATIEGEESDLYKAVDHWIDITDNTQAINATNYLSFDQLDTLNTVLTTYLEDIGKDVSIISEEEKKKNDLTNRSTRLNNYSQLYKLDHEGVSNAESMLAGAVTSAYRNKYDFDGQTFYDLVDSLNSNPDIDDFWYGSSTPNLEELKTNDREHSTNKIELADKNGNTKEITVKDSDVYKVWTEVLGKTADDWANLNEVDRAKYFMPYLVEEKIANGELEGQFTYDNIDSNVQNSLEQLYEKVVSTGGSESAITAFEDYLAQHPEVEIDTEALLNPYFQARQKIEDALQRYGFNQMYKNLGTDNLNSMVSHIEDQIAKGVSQESLSKIYQTQLAALSDAEQETMIKTLNGIDFSQVNIGNIQQTKQAWIKSFQEANKEKGKIITDEEAEREWKFFFNKAKEYNTIDLKINSVSGLEAVEDSINDYMDGVVESADSVASILSKYSENKFIDFSTYRKLAEELEKVNLKVEDFTTATAEGFSVDVEGLAKAYQQQIGDKDTLIKQAKEAIQQGIDELTNEITILEALEGQEQVNATLIKQMAKQKGLSADIAHNALIYTGQTELASQIISESPDDSIFESFSNSKSIDALKKRRTELEEIRDDEEKLLQYSGGSTANAALQQMSRSFEGIATGGEDATKALEDYNDALEKQADALEEVNEKQEDLNEKLKEYNELLYGSSNRKSSLDLLYNYEEAINSFNDEITRSKDLLSDSKSVEESTTALLRYTEATHNLLAEEKAKQQIYQRGLANYANTIENGGVSYTDRETGNNIDVKFGDYVKKDARTGKYMIDQRLINEAQFADKWKDYLEEQVSNYNKYSEDLLKSEDNVRKAEKELQDERNAARQNYVKMEQEIADALKQQYQDEIDELKNKYDSMKDADDDYLDALQEAIDKQRKLREQDQAWEDLAQKEKKLSLMQRDTSGANALEIQDLEKDVEQTREEMLDDAIDNVIDGLSKLYESQQELRDEEMELKEALLDNTLYWNTQAENLASSFESADEYAAYLSSISKEYADMTLTMQQDKLREYGETYEAATEYMSIIAMDKSSETGDFIIETMTVTGEEVDQIITSTAEVFSDEVIRSYNETTQAFTEDMEKAEKAIDDANKALQEAIQKYNECAAAANAAADAYQQALAAQNAFNIGSNEDTEPEPEPESMLYGVLNKGGVLGQAMDDIGSKYEGQEVTDAMLRAAYGKFKFSELDSTQTKALFEESGHGTDLAGMKETLKIMGYEDKDINKVFSDIAHNLITDLGHDPNNDGSTEYFYKRIKTRLAFEKGGLVDFTGPAWVDGSPDRPEAFLSAEDTENIGNAARILSNIPWLDRTTDSSTVVTNNGGDVNVEINLNIDHISSETDIDEMLERVKEEIVEVARPAGTNTILQQEL